MVSFREKWLTMDALCHAKFAIHHRWFDALVLIMQTGYEVSSLSVPVISPGCLQLLEILEISWNLNGPPGNFCVMIENWLMALLHDDVALFVH